MAAHGSDDDPTRSITAIAAGTHISHYTILSKIGAGGMGEVYLAEDTELHRKVALKFLPAHLCPDEDCRKRFKREAQAAAKLDHPNIVAIHEVGEFQGRPFYAMQIIEGQSLKEVIAGKDLLVERILEIGIQICEGLQAAHDNGITHRDLKPSNILLDSHGRVRIVDFGLAAIRGSESLTKTGSTLGTIGYMSPEQVQGKEIDHRSDLFSLGVVLYELITKQSPFKRNSEAATLKAVSDDLPEPLARFKSGLPDELQPILDKALEKDVKLRYQHADGLLSDLVRVKQSLESGESTVSVSAAARKPKRSWSIAAVVIIIALATSIYFVRTGSVPVEITSPQFTKITHTGDIGISDLSRDGSLIAYQRRFQDGSAKIYVHDIDGGDVIEVFEIKNAGLQCIWWLPSGKDLVLDVTDRSGGAVYVISRFGRQRRKLAYAGNSHRGSVVSPDGTRLAAIVSGNRIFYVDLTSGDTSSVPIEQELVFADVNNWIPSGNRILFNGATIEEGVGLYAVNPDGTGLTLLGNEYVNMSWSSGGKALYVTEYAGTMRRLVRMSTDPETGEIEGEPRTVLPPMNIFSHAATEAGDRLMYKQREDVSNLWRVSLDMGAERPDPRFTQLTSQTSSCIFPRISPDGAQIAFMLGLERLHVCIVPTDGETWKQLTQTSIINVPIDWSPDGKMVAFFSLEDWQSTEFAYKIVDIDGGTPHTVCKLPMSHGRDEAWVGSWSPDGRLVVTDGTCSRLWLIDIETGDIEKVPVTGPEGVILEPCVSPNGQRVAFYWNREDDKTDGIWMISLDDFSEDLVAPINAHVFGWGPDGDWVYVWRGVDAGKELGRIQIHSGTIQWLVAIDRLTDRNPTWIDLSPDGTWAVFADLETRSDLWIVEHFDPRVQ